MIAVAAVFAVIIFFDLQRFIRNKEKTRVYVVYFIFMAASLVVSLLLASGIKPPSPAHWIKALLNMIGVIE